MRSIDLYELDRAIRNAPLWPIAQSVVPVLCDQNPALQHVSPTQIASRLLAVLQAGCDAVITPEVLAAERETAEAAHQNGGPKVPT